MKINCEAGNYVLPGCLKSSLFENIFISLTYFWHFSLPNMKKNLFSIFIRISHSTWEEKQHLAKQHLLLRKRLLAAFRDTYIKKWKTLVKTSSLFSRVKIRRIFTLKRDFYCDARLENIQKVSKRAKIWQFMTFLENVW